MKQFKNYLQTQLRILEIKLSKTQKEIETFPSPQDINLSLYGTKEEIKRKYRKSNKPSIIKRITGPSNLDLQTYIRNQELTRLEELFYEYQRKINLIKNYLDVIVYTNITGPISYNEELIKYTLEYASTHNINPKEVVEFLIKICHSTNSNYLEREITNAYDHKEIDLLSNLFKQLFQEILTEQEYQKYSIVINQIFLQIELTQSKEDKQELLHIRESLITLQDYVNGTRIIKTLNIEEFKSLLINACISDNDQAMLLSKMEQKIKEECELEQKNKINEMMKRFLTAKELKLIKISEQKEKELTGPLKDLVSRAKKDVISMCKYLSYNIEVNDIHESLEILSDRITTLSNVLSNINEEQKESNSLFYVTDKEGIPLFLRNLEIQDLSDYQRIYSLLYQVASNKKGKKYMIKDQLIFYYIGDNQLKVVYIDTAECRIVVGIDGNGSFPLKKLISSDMVRQIEEISLLSITKDYRDIHSTYESIILDALNIEDKEEALTLKKNNF